MATDTHSVQPKSSSTTQTAMAGVRQQTGYACEECRRRKTRCDRVRPQCGSCAETGICCVISLKRPPRGPKRGQLKELRSRVATLESQLDSQQEYTESDAVSINHEYSPTSQNMFGDLATLEPLNADLDGTAHASVTTGSDGEDDKRCTPELTYDMSASSVISTIPASTTTEFSPCHDTAWDYGGFASPEFLSKISSTHLSFSPDISSITDLMQADLDQLYFDRFHLVAPILHRGRYSAWASKKPQSNARACLRSAVRTVASALSASFRPFSDALYAETCRLLEIAERSQPSNEAFWATNNNPKSIPLEHIQTLLLLAHYEVLCIDEQKAILTAGHVFRLVQMTRLYEVDKFDRSLTTPESFVELEEKRRTFWVAFNLDRFFCCHEDLPLTLHEELATIRLPVPESSFQWSQPVCMEFLSEAIASPNIRSLSPFSECIVLASLYGRCITHRQKTLATGRGLPAQESHEFWTRQERLASLLERRTKILEQNASALPNQDPVVLFTRMLACCAAIHLNGTVERAPWFPADNRPLALAYEDRAHHAAAEVARLSQAVPTLSCFKVHPFVPNALACSAVFFATHSNGSSPDSLSDGSTDVFQQLLSTMQGLRDINNLARDHLESLKTSFCMTGMHGMSGHTHYQPFIVPEQTLRV